MVKFRHILFVRSGQPENVYGRFALEILRSEGLNGFEVVDLDTEPFPVLAEGDLAVLTRCFLRKAEMELLHQGVTAGARVVCIQPSWGLADRFGLKSRKQVLNPGWVRIGQGFPGAGCPIQTHRPIALYEAQDGVWARLAEAVDTEWKTGYGPAAVRGSVGQGEVVFFFYDLPAAVAAIRFGNPELASLLTSKHWGWTHAPDLFAGWADDRVVRLPQADFHGQFLAKVLTDISPYPLPRFWYYPRTAQRSAAVFQSDDDMSTWEQFTELSNSLLRHEGKATFYLMRKTLLTDAQVAELRSKGHTFAPHAFGVDGEEDLYFRFPEVLTDHTREFKERFGACSTSLQCHYAPWMGYMSWVPLHVQLGYRLLFAYFSSPQPYLNTFLCGSGRAMRFYDRDGTLYDCRQQPIITYDDSSIRERVTKEPEGLVGEFENLLMPAVERTHTAFGMLSHPVSFVTYSRPFIERCFDALHREGAPIFNGDEWTTFLDSREAVRITHRAGTDGGISCVVSNLEGPLPLMVPVEKGRAARVAIDGVKAAGEVHRRLEQDYLFVQLDGKPGKEICVDIG